MFRATSFSVKSWVIICLSFAAWLTSMTRTIATKLGYYPFKTECMDSMESRSAYCLRSLKT